MGKEPNHCHIPYRDTGYFSDFICRYIEEDASVKSLYHRFPSLDNFQFQIDEKAKSYASRFRQILADVLQDQYAQIEVSSQTDENIQNLKKENTFTITTGHQLNLFTGPLYFLYKIISVIKLAHNLKLKYKSYNFVPVFWMASEDHDFEEINFFNLRGKKIRWNTDQTGAVGPFNTSGLEDVFEVVSKEFGNGTNAQQLKSWFKEAYLNCDTLADATRYLANALFGEYGLVVIDANEQKLKRCFIPQMEKELLENVGYKSVSSTNNYLEEQGLKIQVNPREVNLFYLMDGQRERIIFEDGKFAVAQTNISWTKDGLLAELHLNPERFSPNVIMRPLYQEVILPNLCYIGGGGEMIYWLQLKSNFESQNVTFPILSLRNSVLIKSQKQSKKQKRLGLTDKDLFLGRNSLINKRVRSISNIDIDFSEQKEHLKQQFKALYELASKTDASFLGAVKAQEVKQIKGLAHLEKRLLKAQKRKLADQISRATELQEQLFPNRNLQERRLNFSELYLEYGEDLVATLYQYLNPLHLQFTIVEA